MANIDMKDIVAGLAEAGDSLEEVLVFLAKLKGKKASESHKILFKTSIQVACIWAVLNGSVGETISGKGMTNADRS
jgi:hypothetical protein